MYHLIPCTLTAQSPIYSPPKPLRVTLSALNPEHPKLPP